MSDYTLSTTVRRPHAATVEAVRQGLGEQGFGVLTEIDLAATLREKIGAEVAPQVVLGACRPQLAHEAIQADPSVATVLPCNVVVRALDDETTVVEVFDPAAMVSMSGAQHGDSPLATVAADARGRLTALLEALA